MKKIKVFLMGFLLLSFFSCDQGKDIIPTERVKVIGSKISSLPDDFLEFLKTYNLKIIEKEVKTKHTFNSFDEFKSGYLKIREKINGKEYNIKLKSIDNLNEKNGKPNFESEYTVSKTFIVYDYEGNTDIQIVLTYRVGADGRVSNITVNSFQFGPYSSNQFSHTTIMTGFNPTSGNIAGSFVTTQQSGYSIGLFTFGSTSVTDWKIELSADRKSANIKYTTNFD